MDIFIRKSKIENLVQKHRNIAKKEAKKEYDLKVEQLVQKHEQDSMLAEKDYNIELAELQRKIERLEQKEKLINRKEHQLISDQARLEEASKKMSLQLAHMGETIIKSGAECQGIFEEVKKIM